MSVFDPKPEMLPQVLVKKENPEFAEEFIVKGIMMKEYSRNFPKLL